ADQRPAAATGQHPALKLRSFEAAAVKVKDASAAIGGIAETGHLNFEGDRKQKLGIDLRHGDPCPHNGKKRRLAAKPSPPCPFKALIRRGSRLAVMHANNDPLGVRSASVSGSDAEGRPFEVRQSARPTFRALIVNSFSEVSRGTKRVSCWFR